MQAGAVIGSYIVERELGRGGMGVVYLARDTRLERPVVLKTLPASTAGNPASLARFRNEALLLASLDHPRIGGIYSLEEDDGAVYLVLEYVPGESLAERLQRGPLTQELALGLAVQLASAVEAAHHRGIIHRDLKPANVRITPEETVKVLDFGLARSIAPSAERGKRTGGIGDSPTLSLDGERGGLVGTPQYMSPEQSRGGAGDERGDIWAFGCILYECLTARRPFEGDSLADILAATLTAEPDWSLLPARTDPRLRRLLMRCLNKDADRRPAGMWDVRAEIEAVLRESPARPGADLITPGEIPNNLPRHLTSFIGREGEIARIAGLLASTRLLTLTGPGGCGKTRLALEAAAFGATSFPDGVWLVELASLTDPKLVLPAVAGVVGVREEPGGTLTEALAKALRASRVLIVLDNCEHLLAAAAGVARMLLGSCAELRILATSREGMAIPGETLFVVPPLTMPAEGVAAGAASIGACESVRLLVERAREVRPDFSLTEGNSADVARICRRLDGIPLAIELAAARVRVLSVGQIDERLDDRLRLLTDGSRTERERHRTLRAAVDWSYDLLSPDEKKLFRSLAVFAGGFTLESAWVVCGKGLDEFDLLDLLTHLVDKSLVQVEENPQGQRRYALLDTLRDYAAARLDEAGETASLRDRHVDAFITLAERSEGELTGPRQKRWLDRLEAERRNHFAALEWCSRSPERAGKQLALCSALWLFWHRHGHYGIGREALADALSRPEAAARTALRAKALRGAGILAWRQTDYDASRALQQEALSIHMELGDEEGIAMALNDLGNISYVQREYQEARRFHREALALRRKLEDPRGIAASLTNLGNVAFDLGELAEARAMHQESLAIYRRLGNAWGIAAALSNIGVTARGLGGHEEAIGLAREALAIQRELGDRWGIGASLTNLSTWAIETNDRSAARSQLTEALTIWRDLGDRMEVAETLELVASLAALEATSVEAAASGRGSSGTAAAVVAARLLVAAQAIRDEIHSPLPAGDLPRVAQAVAAARGVLGDAGFDKCQVDGRRVGWAEALGEALAYLGNG